MSRDALPDYWGRLIVNKKEEYLTDYDYISITPNRDIVGNIIFSKETPSNDFDIIPLEEILPIISNFEDYNIHSNNSLLKTSLGGSRPKQTVIYNNIEYVAKFNRNGDKFNNVLIEYATLKLAQLCGLNIVEAETLTYQNHNILLLKRFDRINKERLPFLSALSLSQCSEEDRNSWLSYFDMAQYLNKEDKHELFKRMVFNALISNIDDHPRNHGFLNINGILKLSPGYDIVPTPQISYERKLALNIGEQNKNINFHNLYSKHYLFDLEKENAIAIILNMINIIKQWKDIFSMCHVSNNDIKQMESAFIMNDIVSEQG